MAIGYNFLYPDINTVYGGALNATFYVPVGGLQTIGSNADRYYSDQSILGIFKRDGDYGPTWNSDQASFVGWEFYDVNGTINRFTSVTLSPATNMVGLDASRISFDADHIWVNFKGLSYAKGDVVSLDLASSAPPVPEPETYSMMVAGLGILGLIVRRRKTA